MIGTSTFSNRGNNLELLDPRLQQNTLDDLASNKKNLLICTSVAEEGIDIAACNLVICFEPPPNLKSFIQRRGRARKSESKYVLFLKRHQETALSDWRDLEVRMTDAYMNETRELESFGAPEEQEDAEMVFRIDSTG